MAKRPSPALSVGADIARARTLPKAFYLDDAWFERAGNKIFAPSWQFIGDSGMLEAGNTVHPFTLFKGWLDEPLVLTHDEGGAMRCLSNVCTHRGNLVADRACRTASMRCGYHGRTFGLDGTCQSMPEFEGVAGFPAAADNLKTIPVHRWGNFLFVSLAPKTAPGKVFAAVTDRLNWMPMERLTFSGYSRDYEVDAHWALYCENYLEGFHIPYVHRELNKVIDYDLYRTEPFRHGCLQVAHARDGREAFTIPPSSPDHGKRIAAYYYFIFPNLMFNFYPWGLSVNIVRPVSPGKSVVSFLSYILDESLRDSGAGADLDRVEMEDEEVVLNVQRGIRSRFYTRGRYSVKRETGVHHFHRMIAAAVAQ